VIDPTVLARELLDARDSGRPIEVLPSSRDAQFELAAAYTTEAEIARLRRAAGRTTVGRKVGYASKALWRVLKLDTIVWAHMYDDTVRYARAKETVQLPQMVSPKIEPEIVFKLAKPLGAGADAAAIVDATEWIALGFEIIDCPFPDWQLKPVDFVAAFGLHRALVVGAQRRATQTIVDALPSFSVKLLKNDELVDEGSGKNALRSPALCLAELASALGRQPGAEPLAAGELISTGTLTTSQPVAAGETWTATLAGLDIPDLTTRF
jgi:2-oxo-3-hexenedioate decarboxylase